ncbi:MAG TPA: c-type cytochrome [Caulobacteraceae bacterium]
MFSPCLNRTLAAVLATATLSACDTHNRPATHAPYVQSQASLPPTSELYPGVKPVQIESAQAAIFQADPIHIANGKRYYSWYNCSGCHFNGGGGIGPQFMNGKWTYGGSLAEIHNSIAQGRPNGMPVWGGTIPDNQIWEIAAYVKSLSKAPPDTKTDEKAARDDEGEPKVISAPAPGLVVKS